MAIDFSKYQNTGQKKIDFSQYKRKKSDEGTLLGAAKEFGRDVSTAFKEGGEQLREARGAGFLKAPIQRAGAAGGVVSDVIGAGVKAVVPKKVEEVFETGVQKAVEKVPGAQEGLQKASEFLEDKPTLSSALQIGEVAGMAVGAGPASKVATKAAKTGAKGAKIAKEAVELVPTGATKSADSEALFKAIRPRITKKKNLRNVKKNVDLAADTIASKGLKPKNLEEFSNAITQTKKDVWSEISGLIKDSDAKIDLSQYADDIAEKASDPNLGVVNPAAQKKVLEFADNLKTRGEVSVDDAESIRQFLNAELETAFGDFAMNQTEKNLKKEFVAKLRSDIDNKISKVEGQSKDLHKRYGALSQVGEDTLKRLIVAQRKSPADVFEQFGRISGLGEIVGGLTSFQKGVDLGRVAKGIAQTALGARAKKIGDPDFLIKKAFKSAGKEKKAPRILQNLKSKEAKVNKAPGKDDVVEALSDGPEIPEDLKMGRKIMKDLQDIANKEKGPKKKELEGKIKNLQEMLKKIEK